MKRKKAKKVVQPLPRESTKLLIEFPYKLNPTDLVQFQVYVNGLLQIQGKDYAVYE